MPSAQKVLVLFILISVQMYSQCTSSSTSLQHIITGIIQMGVPNQAYAQGQYNIVFSSSDSLGTAATIFSAFAIAGFQTAGNQNYYSLIVDQVYFTNDNTAMNIIMNYANTANTVTTQWTQVKLSYLLVSEQFGGISTGNYFGNSYIWASWVQLTPPISNQPIDNNPIFSNSNGAGICGYVDSFPPAYGTNCPSDAKILYHYYIMGFQYNATADYSYEIRFSVRGGTGADNNEADLAIQIQTGVTPNGPIMTIPNFNGNLNSIKIAMVLVVLRDYATYPTQASNPQNFKYSGIFMPLSTYNIVVPIIATSSQNINYFDIAAAQYMFYGFSSLNVATSSGQINVNLALENLYNLELTASNPLSNVLISGDIFSSDLTISCNVAPIQITNVQSLQLSSIPYLATGQQSIDQISSSNGIIPKYSNEYVFDIAAEANGNTDILNFNINITYHNLVSGTYEIIVAFDEITALGLPNNQIYTYGIQINGEAIYINSIITTSALDNSIQKIGLNINQSSPLITLSVSFARSLTVKQNFYMNLDLLQFSAIYDSTNSCCAVSCPAETGVNINSNPPSCVSCNSQAGLYFDSSSNQCQCLSGYYLVPGSSQTCSPCIASLCATCRPNDSYQCLTCVVGATLNAFYLNCSCNPGYVQYNGTCKTCSYTCATCSVFNQCDACADPTHRNILNNCNCISGYYDNQTPNCAACPANCQACTSYAVCTSCFTNSNFTLDENYQCSCSSGFYETINSSGISVCSPCSPQCTQCNGSAYACTFCNSTQNKISGYDSLGHLTCICESGYHMNSVGVCVQSSCVNNSFCVQCKVQAEQSICVQCSDALNSVLSMPSYTCICKDGYYMNNNACVACPTACATCTSNTQCETCVPSAQMSNNNSCQCQMGYFFTSIPTRYCKACDSNCKNCTASGSCLSCLNGFNLTVDGKCTCGLGQYIYEGQCLACDSGCQTCSDINDCTNCISPLILQNGTCTQRCDIGYYRSGSICLICDSECTFCNQTNICLVCNSDRLLYNGQCYQNCPLGTISETTNSTCIPCNSPCETCVVHPSRCTSCQSNSGYLYNGDCIAQCASGTYASNGICQICDFSCSECLGASTVCTACPTGKYLFNGACLNNCPYLTADGNCSKTCPIGYYQSSGSTCSQCDVSCQSCSQNATACTICASTRKNHQGLCVTTCPPNTYETSSHTCQSCDISCNTCSGTKYQCLSCSSDYQLQGTQCILVKNCSQHQYFNYTLEKCQECNDNCQQCTTYSYCTSCYEASIPINGVCTAVLTNCISNCQYCSSSTVCANCSIGYYLQNNSCVLACSYPYSPINGVCQCASGLLYESICIQACPSGYTAIGNTCLECDPSCVQCSQKTIYCTQCSSGYTLDTVTKTCKIPANCPYGQYYDSGYCYRNCSPQTYYQGGFCFYACSSGYQDNGYGGCVATTTIKTAGCAPLFNSSDQCVSQCPSATYSDSDNVCQSCADDCIACINSSICTACSSGYILSNSVCILSGSCLSTQFEYNGDCVDLCPAGTVGYQGLCQRVCSAGQYYYDARCYSECPTALKTAEACVDICPIGYIQSNVSNQQLCVQSNSSSSITVICSLGYYYNQTNSQCMICTSPCASCQNSSICFTCITGYTLIISQCVQQFANCSNGYYIDQTGSCITCPTQCQTCLSSTNCTQCAAGYILNGVTCVVVTSGFLQQLTGITVQSTYISGNSILISMLLPVVPTPLSLVQTNQFFNVLTSSGINTIDTIVEWQDTSNSDLIWVMVNFDIINGNSFLFLSIKAAIMGVAYAALGYSINESNYQAVSVYLTLPVAPSDIQPPANATVIPYNRSDNLPST